MKKRQHIHRIVSTYRKQLLVIFLTLGIVFAGPFIFVPSQAAACSGAAQCISGGAGLAGKTSSTSDLNNVIKNILNLLSVIVGIIAVIMIIVGGFRYITSGGDSSAISGAKNTILFAIIGLVIVVLAQTLVYFVIEHV